jgi:hypothetical protein
MSKDSDTASVRISLYTAPPSFAIDTSNTAIAGTTSQQKSKSFGLLTAGLYITTWTLRFGGTKDQQSPHCRTPRHRVGLGIPGLSPHLYSKWGGGGG